MLFSNTNYPITLLVEQIGTELVDYVSGHWS